LRYVIKETQSPNLHNAMHICLVEI